MNSHYTETDQSIGQEEVNAEEKRPRALSIMNKC